MDLLCVLSCKVFGQNIKRINFLQPNLCAEIIDRHNAHNSSDRAINT